MLATSDQAYAGPPDPAVYTVGLGKDAGKTSTSTITLPGAQSSSATALAGVWQWLLLGVAALIAIGVTGAGMVVKRRRARIDHTVDTGCADNPLVVRRLCKTYPGGFTAVQEANFSVEAARSLGYSGLTALGKLSSCGCYWGLSGPAAGKP